MLEKEMTLNQSFDIAHKELYQTIVQYGTACILGDKTGAIKFNTDIKDSFEILKGLTKEIEKLENLSDERQDILGVMESIDTE